MSSKPQQGPDTSSAVLGVLLCNLGTPDAPTPAALRRYLGEFLWDPRVVEAPRPLWWLVLHGIILRLRPRRSAASYAEVWGEDGSPLLSISRRQTLAVEEALNRRLNQPVRVALGMRYGRPVIDEALRELKMNGAERIVVLPLYPQYSASTSASVFDAVARHYLAEREVPHLRYVRDYHDAPGYIRALANSVRAHWAAHGRGQRLLMSFHGIPAEYATRGDPYPRHCARTAELLAAELELAEQDWQLVFQSRFGPREWLQPYCDKTLEALPGEGIKQVDVICPGFTADCLETLEEIALSNAELYRKAGGERLSYIPALNDDAEHIEFLCGLLQQELGHWLKTPASP
ncbi:ferrochelatase [Alkalilimnicola sp. S0819]|uniref:ferrochelatase n=1 Tax=Alkalilimnicola sp. S0819 TaxID=2613922 RepID=UPI0012629ACF|nr:ferrochelatase [Alkalilimnicola sp. S0819]KAB7622679.1 ferrochelatase [Alkalilimnicola sp. S0819]MPQ17316.1 ferrochelatase [Alkalilimnicola sp. S0819]